MMRRSNSAQVAEGTQQVTEWALEVAEQALEEAEQAQNGLCVEQVQLLSGPGQALGLAELAQWGLDVEQALEEAEQAQWGLDVEQAFDRMTASQACKLAALLPPTPHP